MQARKVALGVNSASFQTAHGNLLPLFLPAIPINPFQIYTRKVQDLKVLRLHIGCPAPGALRVKLLPGRIPFIRQLVAYPFKAVNPAAVPGTGAAGAHGKVIAAFRVK